MQNSDYIPSLEELTVPEIQLTSSVLRAGAFQYGKYCDGINKEFMLCFFESGHNPAACINEGKDVTACGFEFFGKVKASCLDEFNKYAHCIDHAGRQMYLDMCRGTQKIFDGCVKENLGQERPRVGFFSRVTEIETSRPKWEIEPQKLDEVLPSLPK